jgi:hypothetical protein
MKFTPNIEIIVNTQPDVLILDEWTINALKLIAIQNGMLINRVPQFKKALRIFKQSIINN